MDQALLQIAAIRRQRMIWSGEEEILGLAAGNILAFVDLCQAIWAAWLRSVRNKEVVTSETPPKITNEYVQNEGIQAVSVQWFEKIRSEERGDSRMRFARFLGNMFRGWMRDDKNMSYPGYIGFSLPASELEADGLVQRFLNDATAFGVLVCKPHTPRSKKRGASKKWYLHPILCPYFQLPLAHRKEPKDVRIDEVRRWLESISVVSPERVDKAKGFASGAATSQGTLFDLGGDS